MRCALALAIVGMGVAALATDVLPLAEVRPGMRGHGLTVVAGTEIERFEVEVVAVLDEPGERGDFIVVRVSGPAITRSGGVAQGMSGSPIYLDGKLAGALSRAAPWSADRDRPLALVTPIEAMLQVLAEVAPPPGEPRPGDGPRAEEPILPELFLSSPIMASGLSARALAVLERGFDLRRTGHPLSDLLPPWRTGIPGLLDLGVPRVAAAPSGGGGPALDLVPGAPVGVGLAVGDVTIGALGTVTLVRDNAVLAFGHPFLFTGASRYFLTGAHVLDTVAAYDFSYKFGTMGEVRGGVFADRWAAVAGIVGRTPAGIATRLTVRDLSRGAERVLQARLVEEPRLAALLLYVAALEAVDQALDRIGPGTATVRYTLTGRGLPRPLTRENVFLSTEDIALLVPWELALIADVLAYNEFADPGFLSVALEAAVTPGFSAAEVVSLKTERESYAPGDRVRFEVALRRWRGGTEVWGGWLRIPSDLASPYVELRAYGGPRPREKGEEPPTLNSIGDLVRYIEGIPTYDTLTVELFALDPLSEVVRERWLYGVDGAADRIPGVRVYGEVRVVLPLKGK
ncbi:MAG: hypothetical protein N2320_02930 [Candidatus Bipolaricaulota bacterium]|nr:hypothetical protein [Candidatus Bipolaricaulota bacterium]